MLNHNQNVTARRFELHTYVDIINTADAYKLSHLSKLYAWFIFLCVTLPEDLVKKKKTFYVDP